MDYLCYWTVDFYMEIYFYVQLLLDYLLECFMDLYI